MKSKINLIFNKTATMFCLMVVLFLFFAILTNGVNLSPANINNLVMQNGYVIILSMGMLLCTLTGNIDLGIGSVVAAAGATAATLIIDANCNFILAMIVSIIVGALFGVFNGLLISKINIPPFIVTLATMLIARGLTFVILDGTTKGPLPDEFCYLSTGFLPTIQIGKIDLICIIIASLSCILLCFLDIRMNIIKRKHNQMVAPLWVCIIKDAILSGIIMFIGIRLASYSGFPIILVILLIIVGIYAFTTKRTVFGREVYAIGGNEKAAKLSGINTNKVMFLVYLNMGIICGIVGILFSGRNASATARAGENLELDIITACYLGGVATSGGKGSVANAIIGALIIGVLNNGMSLCGLDNNVQKIIKGLVLVGAVAFDIISKRRFKKME